VGDDVLGDDPTVIALEKEAARLAGKPAAVYVPSGTMGNQMAVASHTQPGDAIVIEEEAHILYYEVGAPAVFAGVVSWTVPSQRGIMAPEDLAKRMHRRSIHTPGTTLVCLENTHNRAGGTVIPMAYLAEYRKIADHHGASVHLDGARVFNAAVHLGLPMSDIAQHVDSVNFCLSKGLRSPVGSVLCGQEDFIEKARIWRKRLGGGMRQAGILAAAGLYSLNHYVARLAEDHARAANFATSLQELPGIGVDMASVQTNIVMADVPGDAVAWQERLHEKGVWCFAVGPSRLRFVFHADVDDAGSQRAVEVLA
jgi:threonine aldolase